METSIEWLGDKFEQSSQKAEEKTKYGKWIKKTRKLRLFQKFQHLDKRGLRRKEVWKWRWKKLLKKEFKTVPKLKNSRLPVKIQESNWHQTLQHWKLEDREKCFPNSERKRFQLRVLYLQKSSIKWKGRIKTFGTFEIAKEMTFHAGLFRKRQRNVFHQNMGGNISRRRMSQDPGHRSTQERRERKTQDDKRGRREHSGLWETVRSSGKDFLKKKLLTWSIENVLNELRGGLYNWGWVWGLYNWGR